MLISIDLDSLNIVRIWSFTDLIFPQSDWKRRFSLQISLFSPNEARYGSEKLHMRTLVTQCYHLGNYFNSFFSRFSLNIFNRRKAENINCTSNEASMNNFFSKSDKMLRKLRIYSHALKKRFLYNLTILLKILWRSSKYYINRKS